MISVLILLAFVLLVGLIRAQSALIMLSSLLLVTALGSAFWSRRAVDWLSYRRHFDPPRVFPGEETDYVVEIRNQKRLPLPWVRIDERVPAPLLPVHGGSRVVGTEQWQRHRVVSLGWNEQLVIRQRFACAKRGDYVVGPTEIETGDPLALFPVRMRAQETHALVVYPRMALLDPLPISSRFPFGQTSARPPVIEDPARFAGIRDYRPGDPMHWVDWKASARRMKLQTRVFAPTTLHSVIVALNVQTMPLSWQGHAPAKFEAAIGVVATLVREALDARNSVGLAANSSGSEMEEFQVFLPPNRRPSQLEEALTVLAKLMPLPTMAFGAFLRKVASNFPYGASLVVVTAVLDEELAQNLAMLAERGHAVSVVFLGAELPVRLHPHITASCLPDVTFETIAVDSGVPGGRA
ncbi:MAG: DUF58 domain-containing protein [Chloroflexi bacterium]|nr:DUF58 domain-containing protein [Chloroflexota bacterium]